MIALASLGVLASIPFFHAGARLHRPRLHLVGAGLAAGAALGVALTALAPTDSAGTPTGLVANLGSIALLAVMVVSSLLIIGLRREVYDVPAAAADPADPAASADPAAPAVPSREEA